MFTILVLMTGENREFTGKEVKMCLFTPGAIIGDGDRKSWDPGGTMIWDSFSIFRTNFAILTSYIHARVVVSRVDVVLLRDQLLRIARFSCGFFTAMARIRNQSSSMYFYAPS